MSAKMTRERAEEFGTAWNSGNADLVASFFTHDGAYHVPAGVNSGLRTMSVSRLRSVRSRSEKATSAKTISIGGVQAFFDRFPDGKFENLKVVVAGDIGTFEWDFVATDADGNKLRTAGCDLLQFVGDKVATKNAFRKQRG